MTCVKVKVKDLSPEEKRIHYNKHQKKYDTWKKISQEFRDICREQTKEELYIKEVKTLESERKRLGKKAEKHRLKEEAKELEKLAKKQERNKIRYQKNKDSNKKWCENNKEHYNELAKIRQRRYVERKKLKQQEENKLIN